MRAGWRFVEDFAANAAVETILFMPRPKDYYAFLYGYATTELDRLMVLSIRTPEAAYVDIEESQKLCNTATCFTGISIHS